MKNLIKNSLRLLPMRITAISIAWIHGRERYDAMLKVFNEQKEDLTADFALRRHRDAIYHYDLNSDTVEKVS